MSDNGYQKTPAASVAGEWLVVSLKLGITNEKRVGTENHKIWWSNDVPNGPEVLLALPLVEHPLTTHPAGTITSDQLLIAMRNALYLENH